MRLPAKGKTSTFKTGKYSDIMPTFSLLRGFLLPSSLLLALNFYSALCCCSRRVLPGEDLRPLFESRIDVFVFVGHLH